MSSIGETKEFNKNIKSSIGQEQERKSSSVASRVKTALIALPILFIMLYFQFLYSVLMLIVIYITHSEFHIMQQNILEKLINDYYAEITWKTLMSSPLSTYIFMLCPIILYMFKNSELFACIIPLSLLEIYRIKNFILIHRVLNTNEASFNFGRKEVANEEIENFNINYKMPNPIKTAILKEHLDDSKTSLKEEIKPQLDFNKSKGFFGFFNRLVKSTGTLSTVDVRKFENKDKSKNDENNILNKNSLNKSKNVPTASVGNQIISSSMFNCCLIIIMLDFLFFFVFIYPVCLGISVHNSPHGFTSLLMVVVIAYQCDNGALVTGNNFGKTPFGSPVTPTKTVEGVYGGIVWG
jgi:hypothetical protein